MQAQLRAVEKRLDTIDQHYSQLNSEQFQALVPAERLQVHYLRSTREFTAISNKLRTPAEHKQADVKVHLETCIAGINAVADAHPEVCILLPSMLSLMYNLHCRRPVFKNTLSRTLV